MASPQSNTAQPGESSFEYMLFEGDPDQLRPVFSSSNQISPWIDPDQLNLNHRIGRGPFGDLWIATHHLRALDDNRFHEVVVKMLYPIKDDQLQLVMSRFDEIFSKCLGLERVCFLHGVSIQNGRVCIVMKFYEGSVGDKMARLKGGKLSISDALRYGADMAEGILELHSRGILVLNLKPCNILLDENNRAIVGDIGFPSLLIGLSLSNLDLNQRLGSPNYMAPEQWQPNIRGPVSYETDSWGFGCTMLEMLSGAQPWRGKSVDEIYESVVMRRERPSLPSGLPLEIENVLFGCFEYDLWNRPSVSDLLRVFQRCKDTDYSNSSWTDPNLQMFDKSNRTSYTDWSLLKDRLQISDTVRSRKPKNSCRPECMFIPEGTIVGKEDEQDENCQFYILVRIHGIHDPLRVHSSVLERVTHGFASGDWVRIKGKVGILHSIDRDGAVQVGLIGMDKLCKGSYRDLQMAESYCVGQFVRVKQVVANPSFDWPRRNHTCGPWATGRVTWIYPNGLLEVKFPGRFSFGDTNRFLADPGEVESVNFEKCEGLVQKYQHLEDLHWAVRPVVIAIGIFTAMKLGYFVGKHVRRNKTVSFDSERGAEIQTADGQNPAWLPPSVANILFTSPSR